MCFRKAVAWTAYRVAILARARGSPGPPDQVRRLERYRQEHPDVGIEPPGARSAVWRAFRNGDLIAYGFTLMVFLERLEALPEPLGAAQDVGRRPATRQPTRLELLYRIRFTYPESWAVGLDSGWQQMFFAEGRCEESVTGRFRGADFPEAGRGWSLPAGLPAG